MDKRSSIEPEKVADKDSYMNRGEAAEFLGVSQSTLLRFEESRKLTPYKEANGGVRARVLYRESDVFMLRKNPGDADQELGTAAVLQNAARMVEGSQGFVTKLLDPVTTMQKMLLKQAENQIEKLQDRCNRLEDEVFQFIDVQKKMLREDSEQRSAEASAQASTEMKREAFDKFIGYVPLLATLIGDKSGNQSTKDKIRESAMVDIVDRMSIEQIEQLQKSGIFDMPALATLMTIKDRLIDERRTRLDREESDAQAAGGNGAASL